MAETTKFGEPGANSSHRKFWEHIKAGGRVWRDDPLNKVQEWLDLDRLGGDPDEIQRYGYTNLHIRDNQLGAIMGTKEKALNLEFEDPRLGYAQPVKVKFSRYDGGGVCIRLVTDEGEPWATATVNYNGLEKLPLKQPDGTYGSGVGRVLLKNWDENAQLEELLVAHGILEESPIGHIQTGYKMAPAFQMTRPAMEHAGLVPPVPQPDRKAVAAIQPGI